VYNLISVAFVALLLGAAWSDVRSRRIPNALTVTGLVVALVLRLLMGPGAAIDGLLGILLAFLVVLPFFVLGVMGGGDTKLFMMIGAFMGPRNFLWAAVLIAIIGGMLALVDAGRRGALLPVLFNCGQIMKHWATFGRRGVNRSIASAGAMTIPYGVAIAAGALLWWFAGVHGL
jgi:prepilin peptidase CpaA